MTKTLRDGTRKRRDGVTIDHSTNRRRSRRRPGIVVDKLLFVFAFCVAWERETHRLASSVRRRRPASSLTRVKRRDALSSVTNARFGSPSVALVGAVSATSRSVAPVGDLSLAGSPRGVRALSRFLSSNRKTDGSGMVNAM
ncbi:hypothetical protein YC2023_040637 [Brassica napus]